MKFSDVPAAGITIRESANDGSDFTNPAADYRRLFLGEDGLLHLRDSAGTITDIGGAAGSVATDAIWDAKGDLAGGTGANTAARLAVGSNGQVLGAASGETTGLKWAMAHAFHGAFAYHTGVQSGAGVRTLNTELYDTDGYHDTVTNSSRMTIPSGLDGYYLCRGHISNGAAGKIIRIMKGGAVVPASNDVFGTGGHTMQVLYLAATNYVELYTDDTGNTGHASAVEAMNGLTITLIGV